jgi:hypothetical protein
MAQLSRRRFVALSAAAAGAMSIGIATPASAHGGRRTVDPRLSAPVDRAFCYLDLVQDAYFQGATPRLLQSYNNESGLLTTAFVYDNALAVIAYLSQPTAVHMQRARVIGDALLWIQANDERFTDGRVRQAYAAGPMLFYGGWPEFTGLVRPDGKAAFLWPFGFGGTSVGDAAWAGLALARLYAVTRDRRYLDGAVAIGQWIDSTTLSPFRFGGYLGGVQGDGVTKQSWCSTEHNIDTYALFRMLAGLTRDPAWRAKAQVALGFVQSMWNPAAGHFWTGTQAAAPDEINTSILPEDVNAWGYLALGGRTYSTALEWTGAHLGNTDGGADSELPPGITISGVTFSDQSKVLTGTVPNSNRPNDRNAVWPEGNGHLAAALIARDGAHDKRKAVALLLENVKAQENLGGGQTVGRTSDPNGGRLFDPGEGGTWTGSPLPPRAGIVSATSAFDTGFGFGYFQRQHVGATAWFIMATLGVNPYRL